MDQSEKKKLIGRLLKIDPYWWKWELMDVDPTIASEVLQELNRNNEKNSDR